MLTNFDCSCLWVADRQALVRSLTIQREYLGDPVSDSEEVIDYRDWQVPLGRRFRALKLWFVIRHYGVEGLRLQVRRHVELAQLFRSWIVSSDDLELAAPVPLSLVCFRHRGGDEASRRLLEGLNASGALYLTHTRLDGRYVLRFCVGQTWTERTHVEAAWARIAGDSAALSRRYC